MALQLLDSEHDRSAKVVPRPSDGRGCHHSFLVSEPLSLRPGFREFCAWRCDVSILASISRIHLVISCTSVWAGCSISCFMTPTLRSSFLSILASCGLVIVIYKMTLDWFGPMAAQFAGLFFLFSPLAWFHGIVALTYIVEAFFSGLIGYLCWRIDRADVRHSFCRPRSHLGVSAGVRPSSLLFLTPLFLFSLRNATPKGRWLGLAALALTLTAWFVPMIVAAAA